MLLQASSEDNFFAAAPETSSIHYIEDSVEENIHVNSKEENEKTSTKEIKDTIKNSSFLTDDDKLKIIAPGSTIKNETVSQENSKENEKNQKLTETPTRRRLRLDRIQKPVISDSESPSPKKSLSSKNSTSPKTALAPRSAVSPKKEWKGPDFKVNMKPLGLDKELNVWVQTVKNNPVITATPVSYY